jgi:hypothetical protein
MIDAVHRYDSRYDTSHSSSPVLGSNGTENSHKLENAFIRDWLGRNPKRRRRTARWMRRKSGFLDPFCGFGSTLVAVARATAILLGIKLDACRHHTSTCRLGN